MRPSTFLRTAWLTAKATTAFSWHARLVPGVLVALSAVTVGVAIDGPPASAVSVNEGNGAIGVAYEGSDHTLIFRWQSYGSGNWNREPVAGNGTTYSSPSVAEGNSTTFIAYEGSDHGLIVRWQNYGASGWTRDPVAGSNSAYSQPSIATNSTAVGIAVEGPHHSLNFYWQSYGTTSWNEEPVAPDNSVYDPPSLTSAESSVTNIGTDDYEQNDIFVEGPHHSLDDWEQEGGGVSSDWWENVIQGNGSTYSAPSATSYGKTNDGTPYVSTEVAWEGRGDTLWYYYSDWNASGAQPVGAPGDDSSAPALTIGNGATEIAVDYGGAPSQGAALAFYWQPLDQSGWNPETINPTNYAWSSPTIATGNGATAVVVQGTDNSLVYYWQANGNSQWNEEFPAPDGTTYS